MRVIRHLERCATPVANAVLTLGNFDGVHLGHSAILTRARAEAEARAGRLVVLTFHPHPAAVLAPSRAPQRLQSLHERLECFRAMGADVAIVQRFTPAFAAIEADAFVRDYLCRHLELRHVVVGHRVSFGHARSGSAATLTALGRTCGFSVESLGPVRVGGEEVSSTAVRTMLAAGDMPGTARLLGRGYALRGRVVVGDRRGHTLGFPTANLHVPGGVMLPPDGVYAAWTDTPAGRFGVALNIGVRPTFAGRRRTIEAHLLDFSGDLYGHWLRLELVARLRGEQRFADAAALAYAIAGDVRHARDVLARPARGSVPPRIVTVPASAAGGRLDRFLGTLPEVGTRARGRQLIDAGHVLVDGTVRKPSTELRAGMRVSVEVPPPVPSALEAQDIPLRVLYEDADLLVIDKPAGMVVHPAPGARRDTVVNALLHRSRRIAAVGAAERPGIVHRLDRDTSGVLAVALTPAALEAVARQFRERSVRKEYVGIAHGAVRLARGRIELAVGRDPRERKRMSVSARRSRGALTSYEVMERLPGASVVRLAPHTGRTHQLRVHMQSLGHPLIGDRVYGGTRRAVRGCPAGAAAVIEAFPRQALHAASLALTHPVTGAPLRFEAPLPDDMAALLAALRAAVPR